MIYEVGKVTIYKVRSPKKISGERYLPDYYLNILDAQHDAFIKK